MAQNEPGFVQKHIEKVVLGVCLIVLLFAVFQYGIGTPRRLEVGRGEPVAPGEVDGMILRQAERLEATVVEHDADLPEPLNYTDDLAKLQERPLEGIRLAGAMLGSPLHSGIGGVRQEAVELPTLADVQQAMPAPPAPESWVGKEIVAREDQELREEPVWRAGTLYDFRKLNAAWTETLQSTIIRFDVVCLGYELEIQQRMPGGEWGPAPDVVTVRSGEDVAVRPIPAYDPEQDNSDRIQQFIDAYAAPGWTAYFLQPQWWPVLTSDGPTSWDVHFPVEPLQAFDELQAEAAEAAQQASPVERQGGLAAPEAPGVPGGAQPGLRDPSRRPMPGMPGDMSMPRPGRDDRFGQPGEVELEIATMPTLQEQQQLNVWLAWFHTNEIEYGREYRCRMRLKFVNPLLANPSEVDPEHKEDATVPVVATDWSAWSEPVSISREMEFFVTGANASANTVTVEVFTTALNQRVMARFSGITPGTTIGETATVDLIDPSNPQEIIQREVDFSTGAIALQFDFTKRITTPSGIQRSDTEMVFLSRDGKLERRSKYFDQNLERYRTLTREAEETQQRVSPEEPERPTDDPRDPRVPRNPREPDFPPGMPPDMFPPEIRR